MSDRGMRTKGFWNEEGEWVYWCKTKNRNTTIESLEAALKLIVTDDPEEFVRCYMIATHSSEKRARTTCKYVFEKDEDKKARLHAYYEKNKAYFKRHNDAYRRQLKEEKERKEKINLEVDFEFK